MRLLHIVLVLQLYSSFLLWGANKNSTSQSLKSKSVKSEPLEKSLNDGTLPKGWDYMTDSDPKQVYKQKKFVSGHTAKTLNVKLADYKTISEAKLYARYAGAAYCKERLSVTSWNCSIHCLPKLTSNTKVVGLFENDEYKTRGYIAVNSKSRKVILSFRGSNKWRNFMSDLKVLKLDYTLPNLDTDVKVHRGFIHAKDSLMNPILYNLNHLFKDNKYKDYEVIICGHSLGGAMAVLFSLELKDKIKNKIRVFTYGQPRIGNINFVDYINNSTIPIIRVTNGNDPVPHLPPALMGFRHHNRELFIDNKLGTINCNLGTTSMYEDSHCSAKNRILLNPNSHLKAWDVLLGTYC